MKGEVDERIKLPLEQWQLALLREAFEANERLRRKAGSSGVERQYFIKGGQFLDQVELDDGEAMRFAIVKAAEIAGKALEGRLWVPLNEFSEETRADLEVIRALPEKLEGGGGTPSSGNGI